MSAQNLKEICRKQMKRHLQCAADPRMKPSVRNPPRNRGYFSRSPRAFVLKNTTFRAPAIIPNFTEYCACHEK